MKNQHLNFAKLLKLLEIPEVEKVEILLSLNSALGYRLYVVYRDKFDGKYKRELTYLMKENKSEELIQLILERTNRGELYKTVKEESEKIIKDFLQGFMKSLDDKQRQEVLKKLETLK